MGSISYWQRPDPLPSLNGHLRLIGLRSHWPLVSPPVWVQFPFLAIDQHGGRAHETLAALTALAGSEQQRCIRTRPANGGGRASTLGMDGTYAKCSASLGTEAVGWGPVLVNHLRLVNVPCLKSA